MSIKNIRYKIIYHLVKILTPQLFKEIKKSNLNGLGFNMKDFNFVNKTPRPAITFMKKYFNKRKVSGIEIGVFKGKNSLSILKKLNIEKLYLIDGWRNYDKYNPRINDFDKNYKHVINLFSNRLNVIILKNLSQEIINNFDDLSLDFIYIDGNHQFEYVLQDLEGYFNKIKYNGIISGHDISNIPDVYNAVNSFCTKRNIKFTIELSDWYFIKPKK